MSDGEFPSTGEVALAILIAAKGHDAARRLGLRSRRVRRGGVRYQLLRGAADGLDKAADDPLGTVRLVREARQRARGAESVPLAYW